jgi:transposase
LKGSIKHFVGIDVSSENFTATVLQEPSQTNKKCRCFENTMEGFSAFLRWLKNQKVTTDNSVTCMEATGVYGEALFHYMIAKGFTLAVEPPLKVKRAFETSGHKTDPVDSGQIAEYAYRYQDEIRVSCPRPETVEKLKHLLTARELLVKHSTATKNALTAYRRHVIQEPKVIKIHKQSLEHLDKQIKTINKHIKEVIQDDDSLRYLSQLLVSICGVGILLAGYLLVISNAFQDITSYKSMAAFLGICPYQFKSGKSVYKKPRSRHYGPPYARKLLRLAAQSVSTHNPMFNKYYHRKLAEGKLKEVALNNIANKIIKIAFAVVKNKQQFIKGYQSVNPNILKKG